MSIENKILASFSMFTEGGGWGLKSNSIKDMSINRSKYAKPQKAQTLAPVMSWLSGKLRFSKSSHFLNEGTLK